MAKSIYADVRTFVAGRAGDFTKRDVAANLWPRWRKAGLAATNDFRCFKSYIGNLILQEKADGNIDEVDEIVVSSGVAAKVYRRVASVKAAAKRSVDLTTVETSELVAELNRRFG